MPFRVPTLSHLNLYHSSFYPHMKPRLFILGIYVRTAIDIILYWCPRWCPLTSVMVVFSYLYIYHGFPEHDHQLVYQLYCGCG